MVSLCFSHQDSSIHMLYDLLGSPRDLDLRSNFDLDLSRSCYTCFDASWRGKHHGVKIIALLFQTRKLSPKNCFIKNAVFDLSWPLTPKPLVLGEIWRHLSERAFQELSIAFFKFWCSCYRDRDNAHNMKPCHVIRKFGKILLLMTSGDLNFDFREKLSECFL